MKTSTHRAGGAIVALAGVLCGLSFPLAMGIIIGSTAPDWLEMPVHAGESRYSIIPHRTITHWLLLWLMIITGVLLRGSVQEMPTQGVIGFCLGAIVHVAMDATTSSGVPVFVPWKRNRIWSVCLVSCAFFLAWTISFN